MGPHAWELLRLARLLLAENDRKPPSDAAIRRSISTTYYALFHFMLDECGRCLVGDAEPLARRRNMFVRTISHRGLKLAIGKVTGEQPAKDVVEFLKPVAIEAAFGTPRFVREFASVFLEGYYQRQQADYDLNVELTARHAEVLHVRAGQAMTGWLDAETPAARDFKHGVALLIALQGKLRADHE